MMVIMFNIMQTGTSSSYAQGNVDDKTHEVVASGTGPAVKPATMSLFMLTKEKCPRSRRAGRQNTDDGSIEQRNHESMKVFPSLQKPTR